MLGDRLFVPQEKEAEMVHGADMSPLIGRQAWPLEFLDAACSVIRFPLAACIAAADGPCRDMACWCANRQIIVLFTIDIDRRAICNEIEQSFLPPCHAHHCQSLDFLTSLSGGLTVLRNRPIKAARVDES